MPERVEKCVRSVMDDNPEMDEDRAWAICQAEENEGNLAEDADIASDCPNGQVAINGDCTSVESVDTPASLLNESMHLTLKSLETEPIERIQEDENTVRFTSIRLLGPGIWADSGSQTETYYPPEGIANLEPHWNESEHDGPPLNIMHDIDVENWKPHDASVAGHIDADSVDTDDEGNLYADLVLDTSAGAGQYADENLTSTLESEGAVGFGGPSVEIPAEGLQQSQDEVRDMPRVDAGRLTGAGLVFDPASKNINFAREASRRPVALSADGSPKAKVLTRQSGGMREKFLKNAADRLLMDADEVRETLDMFGFDGLDEMTDDEVMDMAEDLHEDLMADLEEHEGTEMADGIKDDAENIADEVDIPVSDVMEVLDVVDEMADGQQMETHDGEEEEEEEEDDDAEMQDGGDMEAMQERLQSLANRLEDVEDALSQAMQADDVESTLEEKKGQELAAADTTEELDRRLSELENQGKDSKTLADAPGGGDGDFDPYYDDAPASPSGW